MQLRPDIVRQQIANLKHLHPEIAEDEESWMLALESETDLHTILTIIVQQIGEVDALAAGLQAWMEQLRARLTRVGAKQDALRSLAFKLMDEAGIKSMVLPLATLSIRQGPATLVGDAPADELPDDLCKISRAPDRTKIKDALKAGRAIPGYQLSNGAPSLAVRIK